MPYWTAEEEKQLREMLLEKSLDEIAKALNRTQEAIAMKLKRMGLQVPDRQKHSAKNSEEKNSFSATTTTKLEPVKFEALPSPNEAMGLLWSAIRRLQEPDVTKEEAKKLRLIIQGVKTYIHLDVNFMFRIREVERRILVMCKTELVHMKAFADRAEDPAEKEKWQRECAQLQKEIAEMESMGVIEPKPKKEAKPY